MSILNIPKDSLIYKSGDAFAPEKIRRFLSQYLIGSNTSLFYLNNWSIIHFLSGILCGLILYNMNFSIKEYYGLGFLIHTLWETWQFVIGMSIYRGVNLPRQIIDTTVDTILFMTGMFVYVLTKKMK